MTTTHERQSDGTIKLTMTIPWGDVAKTYEEVVEDYVKEAELPGFRKGKAPRNLVEEKLDKSKAYEEVLKRLIPKVYTDAVAQEKLHPVVSPKIEFKEANEGKDWVIHAFTCERPKIELGEYKKKIADLNASKRNKIWTPGEEGKKEKEEEDKPQKPTLDELLMALYESITVILAQPLLEHEVNRLLSDLIDQTKRLGLTVEQYLSSTNRTAESIHKEYEEQAKRTLSLEFGLEEIADKEGIIVSDDDIDAVVKTAKSDDEKTALEKQRYYLASVLRRQKTLDFLAAL